MPLLLMKMMLWSLTAASILLSLEIRLEMMEMMIYNINDIICDIRQQDEVYVR